MSVVRCQLSVVGARFSAREFDNGQLTTDNGQRTTDNGQLTTDIPRSLLIGHQLLQQFILSRQLRVLLLQFRHLRFEFIQFFPQFRDIR